MQVLKETQENLIVCRLIDGNHYRIPTWSIRILKHTTLYSNKTKLFPIGHYLSSIVVSSWCFLNISTCGEPMKTFFWELFDEHFACFSVVFQFCVVSLFYKESADNRKNTSLHIGKMAVILCFEWIFVCFLSFGCSSELGQLITTCWKSPSSSSQPWTPISSLRTKTDASSEGTTHTTTSNCTRSRQYWDWFHQHIRSQLL